jgi:hypothetical protein
MIFSMTGEEKGDLLIQVTAWAGLSVYIYLYGFTDSILWTGHLSLKTTFSLS